MKIRFLARAKSVGFLEANLALEIKKDLREEMPPAEALAICVDPKENGVYLFYCDNSWQVITDTWHATIEEAKAQAEFEYAGISQQWKDAV